MDYGILLGLVRILAGTLCRTSGRVWLWQTTCKSLRLFAHGTYWVAVYALAVYVATFKCTEWLLHTIDRELQTLTACLQHKLFGRTAEVTSLFLIQNGCNSELGTSNGTASELSPATDMTVPANLGTKASVIPPQSQGTCRLPPVPAAPSTETASHRNTSAGTQTGVSCGVPGADVRMTGGRLHLTGPGFVVDWGAATF
jgi:hypothetical protein